MTLRLVDGTAILSDAVVVGIGVIPETRLVAASGMAPNGAIARDIRWAEMMVARRAYPEKAALAWPEVEPKALLADRQADRRSGSRRRGPRRREPAMKK